MKKLFSYIVLLFILVSQFQFGIIHAADSVAVKNEQNKNIETLDKVENALGGVIDKLDSKIKNTETKAKLVEKEKEIAEYIAQTQEKISAEGNTEEIEELVAEAKKTVVLKVIAGVTKTEDTSESIESEVADTPQEKQEALDTITDSLKTKSGEYSLIIKSKYEAEKVENLFAKFDDSTQVEKMYSIGDEDYYEVFIGADSIFRKEMLTDIESGNLPKNFVGIQIVMPEVYGINDISNLQTENLEATWGVKNYNPTSYLETVKNTNAKIRVGVVDTGIDYNHPDLKGKVVGGYDFVNDDSDAMDDQGHGTHVAGTIGANLNGQGIVGVNPYVELVPLKICNARGFCPSYAVIKALEYSKTQKIDILNMSLGGRGNPNGHAICDAIASTVQSGTIIVAASGNSNIDTSRFVPGGCSEAITVAAVDNSMNRAPFSNYGSKVDVAAPGVNVYSTYLINKGEYKNLSGTSMATPHIVGLVSVMKTIKPNISTSEIKSLFEGESRSVTSVSAKPIGKYAVAEKVIAAMINPQVSTPIVKIQDENNSNNIDISEYSSEDESIDSDILEPVFISLDGSESSSIQSDDSEAIEVIPEVFTLNSVLEFEDSLGIANSSQNTIENYTYTGSNNAIVVDIPEGIQYEEIEEENDSDKIGEVINVTVDESLNTDGNSNSSNATQYFNLNGSGAIDEIKINSLNNEPLIEVELEEVGELEIVIPEDEIIIEEGVEINSFGEDEIVDDGGIVEESEEGNLNIEDDDLVVDPNLEEQGGIEINNFEEDEIAEEFQEGGIEINSVGTENEYIFDEEVLDDEGHEEEGFGIQSAIQGDVNGLIAEYLLDGDVNDSSINDNHGTLHGATWKTANQEEARKIGQSKYLSIGKNTTNYVELPDGIINGLDDFTISFWVKRTDSGGYYQVLNAFNNKLLIGFIGDTVAAVTNAVYGDRINTPSRFVKTVNTWNHYTITVEGSVMKVYENGIFLASKNRTPKTITGATGIVIGQEQDAYHGGYDANQSLAGDIANLKIYNRALSESQAQNVFHNSDSSDTSRSFGKVGPGGLIAEYNLDGDTLDSSQNNNHGTLHGSTWKTASDTEAQLIGQDKYLSIGKNITDYVELPDGIVNGLENFTMSVWLKRTNDTSYYPILNAFNNRILFSFTNSNTYGAINGSYGDNFGYKPKFITHKNSWNHYSFVMDGQEMRLYENGKLIATKARTTKVISDVTGIIIGQEQDTYHGNLDVNQSLASDIAGVKIYNKAIDESEASNVYYNNDITDNGREGKIYHEGIDTSVKPTKIRYIRDWLSGSNKNGGNFWVEIQALERFTGENKAIGKQIIATQGENTTHPYSRITDGSIATSSYSYGGGGLQNVTVDLEDEYDIEMLKVWHYYGDERTFNRTKTEVSSDGIHWYALHDSEIDGTYAEPKNGQGRTYELRNTISYKPSQVRYIRDHASGSTSNAGSHWVEIQAYDSEGVNVAQGKKVTSKYDISTRSRPYSRITDGDTTSGPRTASKFHYKNWMQVDLGATYNLEMLKVWHYYADGRTYDGTKTEVSVDGINWYPIFDSEKEGLYPELRDGSGKIYRLSDEPIKKSCVINKGKVCSFWLHQANLFDFETTNSNIAGKSASGLAYMITGNAVGNTTYSIKKDGVTYYEIDVEVIPAYQEHSMEVVPGQKLVLNIANADEYDLSTSHDGFVAVARNSGQIHVTGASGGSTAIYLKYKGVYVATINVKINYGSANIYKCGQNLGGTCAFSLGQYAQNHEIIVSDGSLADFEIGGFRGREILIKGKKEGFLVVSAKYRGNYVAAFHITIKEPEQKYCEVLEGEKCIVKGLPQYYNFQIFKDEQVVGEHLRDGSRSGDPKYVKFTKVSYGGTNIVQDEIQGLRGGKVDIEVSSYSRSFDFKLYDIATTVHEADFPVETPLCNTRVNGSCTISLRNVGTDKYSYFVSQGGLANVIEGRDYLYFKATAEGEFEVLIKNNETGVFVHRAIINISGEYRVLTPSEFSDTEINLEPGQSKTIQILQGTNNRNYRVVKYSQNVSVSLVGTDSFKITVLDASIDRVKIAFYDEDRNYSGEQVYVNVGGEGDGSDGSGDTKIINVYYTKSISTTGIGTLLFDTIGNHNKVGITYIGESGNIIDKDLEVQDDGKYVVVFKNIGDLKGDLFRIYYELDGNKVFYDQDIVISYYNQDGIKTANSEIEINSTSYEQFQNSLYYIWYNKGYSSSYEKIYDMSSDVKGEAINLVLQGIATTANLNIDNQYITIETLPVSGYMLDKFLNGPVFANEKTRWIQDKFDNDVKAVLFNNNDWISNKFENSVDYNNILLLREQNKCNFYEYRNINLLQEGEETYCIFDTSAFDFNFPLSNIDLYMFTGNYNYSLSFFKKDGKIYSKIKFWDEYDFEPNKYGYTDYSGKEDFIDAFKKNVSNNLNYLGNYSEKNLSGTPYWWEVEIINIYN